MLSTRAKRFAPWSASKIQAGLRCSRLFHYRYVDRLEAPEIMAEMEVGKAVHSVLEAALKGDSIDYIIRKRAEMLTPVDKKRFLRLTNEVGSFKARIAAFRRKNNVQKLLVEHRLGISSNFSGTTFGKKETVFRGIFDLGLVWDETNMAVVDHKSGVRFAMSSIGEQLESYAVLAMTHFPKIQKIWLGVHWVAQGELEWTTQVTRQHVNNNFLPRLVASIEAAALAVSDGPRENPGSWCQRCVYRSVCPSVKDTMFEPVDDGDEFWDDTFNG